VNPKFTGEDPDLSVEISERDGRGVANGICAHLTRISGSRRVRKIAIGILMRLKAGFARLSFCDGRGLGMYVLASEARLHRSGYACRWQNKPQSVSSIAKSKGNGGERASDRLRLPVLI